MFIPCTYMCTNCNFGIFLVAFLSKWRPQKSIPCTYTCTKCSLGAVFGCVFDQNGVPKTAFRARIRVHNALFGYFWVRFLVQKVIWSLHSSVLNFVTYFVTYFSLRHHILNICTKRTTAALRAAIKWYWWTCFNNIS